mgnify:CR=1 FL=1
MTVAGAVLILLLLLLSRAGAVAATQPPTTGQTDAVRAVSLGNGQMALFWSPALAFYNGGGWQLKVRETGEIVARWGAQDLERGLAALSEEQQSKLRPFLATLDTGNNRNEAKKQIGWLALGGMADFTLARALGMACLLEDVPPGQYSYSLTILDAKGRPVGKELRAAALDSRQASPAPPAAIGLRAENGENGLELYWSLPENQAIPVPFFLIGRSTEDGPEELLTPDPLWMSAESTSKQPAWVDNSVPLENRVTYRVRLRDIFGRFSEPAVVSVWAADPEAVRPPGMVMAKAADGRVDISWTANDTPYTAGYVVERSRRSDGPYEVLTPNGLSAATEKYADGTAQEGFDYYYRVRAVGSRGDVGEPSAAQGVMNGNADRPKTPGELQGMVEPTRVRLSWQALPFPVAGYIVEKKMEGEEKWVRLNSELVTRAAFDDPLNLGDYGRRCYRICAVAFGNQLSKPSKEISVQLPGHPPVPPPFLDEVNAEKGSVKLLFHASQPQERTVRMLLVRGNSPDDMGLIIDGEIDGKRTSSEDRLVKPGEDYWYALLAEDREGHRSALGNKLFVIAGSTEIPRPARPAVKLQKEPFSGVIVRFEAPEGFLRAAVMRRLNDGPWVTIASDIAGVEEITDADPPRSGKLEYRVVYLDESHSWGPPSESVSLEAGK